MSVTKVKYVRKSEKKPVLLGTKTKNFWIPINQGNDSKVNAPLSWLMASNTQNLESTQATIESHA